MTIYTVTKVKSFMGGDCPGFNATLLRDGRPVCFVIDSGNGGCYEYQWNDYKVPKVDVEGLNIMGKPFSTKGTPEEALFFKHLMSLSKDEDGDPVSDESFIARLVDAFENEKRFTRTLRTSLIVKVGKDVFTYKLNGRTSDAVFPLVQQKHPTAKILRTPAEVIAAMGG